MKYTCLFIGTLLVFQHSLRAQKTTGASTPSQFVTILQGGILEGEADKSFGQLQLVNGIQRQAWFYGIGVGVDYYGNKRSIPLFADVRRNLLNRNNTPFVFADAGYNFNWLREDQKVSNWGTDYDARGGLFYEAGLGYKFTIKGKAAVGLSAGYSYKQHQESYAGFMFIDPIISRPTDTSPREVFNYQFRRISVKLNCSF